MNDKTALIREVNDGIALVAQDFTRNDPSSTTPWSFLCECGEAECQEWVGLQLASFRRLREDEDGIVLAPGHARERAARAVAHELAHDTRALKAQARQQIRRARTRRAAG